MPRAIDRLPVVESPKKIKLVVASCSRTATLGLYQALKVLGYRPYHMYELVMVGGPPHIKVLEEGMRAHHDRFSGVRRYDKADFDRWFAGYDALVEMPAYFDPDCLEAYVGDPDVRFILTERSPASWVRSFNTFLGNMIKALDKLPLNVLRYFNHTLNLFTMVNLQCYDLYSDCTRVGQPGNEAALARNYSAYIARVKRLVPADRMLVIRIEDGLGWEQICPYLGKDVPDEPYPRGVEHEDMKDQFLEPLIRDAMLKFAATVAVPLAVGAWYAWDWYARR